jgi:hypothetical protein
MEAEFDLKMRIGESGLLESAEEISVVYRDKFIHTIHLAA